MIARPCLAWTYEQKCETKTERADAVPHLYVKIVDGKQTRKFQHS